MMEKTLFFLALTLVVIECIPTYSCEYGFTTVTFFDNIKSTDQIPVHVRSAIRTSLIVETSWYTGNYTSLYGILWIPASPQAIPSAIIKVGDCSFNLEFDNTPSGSIPSQIVMEVRRIGGLDGNGLSYIATFTNSELQISINELNFISVEQKTQKDCAPVVENFQLTNSYFDTVNVSESLRAQSFSYRDMGMVCDGGIVTWKVTMKRSDGDIVLESNQDFSACGIDYDQKFMSKEGQKLLTNLLNTVCQNMNAKYPSNQGTPCGNLGIPYSIPCNGLPKSSTELILIIVVGSLFVVVATIIVIFVLRRWKLKNQQQTYIRVNNEMDEE